MAYLLVWILSGFLHGAVFLIGGSTVAAVLFGLIFVGLGIVGSVVILVRNHRRRVRRVAR